MIFSYVPYWAIPFEISTPAIENLVKKKKKKKKKKPNTHVRSEKHDENRFLWYLILYEILSTISE